MAKRGCPKTMKLKSIAWGRPLSIILPGKFIFSVIFAAVLICQSCLYKSAEKRMRTVGTDFSSGWACVAMNQGCSGISTISTIRPSGERPESFMP